MIGNVMKNIRELAEAMGIGSEKLLLITAVIIILFIATIRLLVDSVRPGTINYKKAKRRKKKRRKQKPLEHGDHTAEYIEAAWKEVNK
ncbi:MAG: hypothetical protein HDR14_14800 [Lachnospiraceae bacterium]|nr:hypothetical protein [Lachnospiraceae bacterium]